MKVFIPQLISKIVNSISENEIMLLVGRVASNKEYQILESLVYNEERHLNYLTLLPKNLFFIGFATNLENEKIPLKAKELLTNEFEHILIRNGECCKLDLNEKIALEIEGNENFAKRLNFFLLQAKFEGIQNSEFFCSFENEKSELFYSPKLQPYSVDKGDKKKGKKPQKSAPIAKDNSLKEFSKRIKTALKTNSDESLKMNKHFNIPIEKVNVFTTLKGEEEEIVFSLNINEPRTTNHVLITASLDESLEDTMKQLVNELPRINQNVSLVLIYNEFCSCPLLVPSNAIEWGLQLARVPSNWPSSMRNELNNFEGKPIDVHKSLNTLKENFSEISMVKGSYAYFHYLQDGFNDEGWGCAYRSLQSLLSWYKLSGIVEFNSFKFPRTLKAIQEILVSMGEQEKDFIGSEQWIGSIEVGYVISHLTKYEHKILFIQDGGDVLTSIRQLIQHFKEIGSPIMFGGSLYAYTLLGIAENGDDTKFLILDPHYTGTDDGKTMYEKKGVSWRDKDIFKSGEYYNFCLPQLTKIE